MKHFHQRFPQAPTRPETTMVASIDCLVLPVFEFYRNNYSVCAHAWLLLLNVNECLKICKIHPLLHLPVGLFSCCGVSRYIHTLQFIYQFTCCWACALFWTLTNDAALKSTVIILSSPQSRLRTMNTKVSSWNALLIET